MLIPKSFDKHAVCSVSMASILGKTGEDAASLYDTAIQRELVGLHNRTTVVEHGKRFCVRTVLHRTTQK